jgi:Flp pilus assembly protein TadB
MVPFYFFASYLTGLVASFVASRMSMMVSVMLVIGMFSLPRFRLRDYQRRKGEGHDRQSHYNSFHDMF